MVSSNNNCDLRRLHRAPGLPAGLPALTAGLPAWTMLPAAEHHERLWYGAMAVLATLYYADQSAASGRCVRRP
eukprot:4237571-Prymnesium_polylepis.1